MRRGECMPGGSSAARARAAWSGRAGMPQGLKPRPTPGATATAKAKAKAKAEAKAKAKAEADPLRG